METIASNPTASIVFIVLYLLAFITAVQLLMGSSYKLPEKLQWMGRVLEVPFLGPVAYWLYHFFTGKKKEKHNTPHK